MRVLHLVATPRGARSNTRVVSEAFLQRLQDRYPDLEVEVVDLFDTDLPSIAGDNITVKYTLMVGEPIDRAHQESWRRIEALIAQFLRADVYVITAPMWNLGIPYALKYYIDCIVQPGYLFRYDERGQAVPMVLGKRMVCVTSRGGDYSEGTPMRAYDHQEPYLGAIFAFVGVTDLQFVNVQPMDVTVSLRAEALHDAVRRVEELAAAWESVPLVIDLRRNPPGLKPKPLGVDTGVAVPLPDQA